MTPMQWLLGSDTGISSETICAVLTGTPISDIDAGYPHDPDDFGRCYRLLNHFPEWKKRLPAVACAYPEWTALVREWDHLTMLYEEEIKNADGRAPKLYKRMQELINEGLLVAGWENPSPGYWRKHKKEK